MWPVVSRDPVENVKRVVSFIDETHLAEEELVLNPELNELLDPIRTTRPLRYRCSVAECQTTLAYWGLASGHQARIIPGPKRKPRGKRSAGTYQQETTFRPGEPPSSIPYIQGGAADLEFPDFGWEQKFDPAIEYAQKVADKIRCEPNPDVGSGWPLRWEFICPGPGPAHYEYTNKQMLRMFAHTLYLRQDTIRHSRIW